jgi:DNA replication protein DnaC
MAPYANEDERAALAIRPAYSPNLPGLPAGRFALPRPEDYAGTNEGRDRIREFIAGRLPATGLQPEEVQFLRDEHAEQVAKAREHSITLFNNRVPYRYRNVDPAEPRAVEWATQFTADPRATPSLLILGATGTGKTHLAYAIVRAVAETGTPAAIGWRATTAADLYAALQPRPGVDSETEFRTYARSPLLFLDDLGAAKGSEWTEQITYRLINYRYEQCLPSIVTSNVPPADLREVVGERVASRLFEMTVRVSLKGDDRRRKPTE